MYALMRFHVPVNAGFFVLVCFSIRVFFRFFIALVLKNITCFVEF